MLNTKTFIALLLATTAFANPLTEVLQNRAASSRYASPSADWTLQGCSADKYPNARVLEGAGYTSGDSMSLDRCLAYCEGQQAVYAGLEAAYQCFCSNEGLKNGGAYGPNGGNLRQQANDGCNLSCRGNGNQACGGDNRIQVYKSNKRNTPTVPTIEGATYQGCYADSSNRLLPVTAAYQDMANTNQKCTAACKKLGYDLAGTEHQNECYCGSSSKVKLPAKTTGCNQACSGDSNQICGGNYRLTIFKVDGVSNGGGTGTGTTTPTTTPTGTSSSTTTPTTSPTPTGPTAPAKNPASYSTGGAEYFYAGCFTDRSDASGRALTEYYSSSSSRTVEGCLRTCQKAGNFIYAGLENGECAPSSCQADPLN